MPIRVTSWRQADGNVRFMSRSWWHRLKAAFKREAADVGEGIRSLGKTFDDELDRKERELAVGPADRIEMLLEEQQAEDARFRELQERVLGQPNDPRAAEEQPTHPGGTDSIEDPPIIGKES